GDDHGNVGAQREHRGMCHMQNAQQAADEGQPHRHHGVHTSEAQAAYRQVDVVHRGVPVDAKDGPRERPRFVGYFSGGANASRSPSLAKNFILPSLMTLTLIGMTTSCSLLKPIRS